MGLPLPKSEKRFTYGDYVTWPEDERWELIDGIAYDMTPAPLLYHQDISMKIATAISNFLKGKTCKVFAAPFDVRFLEENQKDEDSSNVLQPDISVICDRSKLDKFGCKGAPDMVVEIISPSTARKDIFVKFYTYEHFGVKEYWLVFPAEKMVEVFILGENNRYGRPEFYAEDKFLPCATLPGLEINLAEVFVED